MSREEEMYSHVLRWRQSGLSKGAYAERLGMSYQTLHYWIRKCEESEEPTSAGFVPVTVVNDEVDEAPVRLVITLGAEIRIEVR